MSLTQTCLQVVPVSYDIFGTAGFPYLSWHML